ncbi:MAG TPA: sigma-70 family RNA polymerase sigma factor, partial [Solirubrobacterales bacterium]|nr:sigma-70 family RNA polymerase sigma factor [Solirubrobacterales bacterium]
MNSGRLTTRLLGTRALRLQPDGRLVALVRDGYESAFEEIFRRYGAALRTYAASIVTIQRADDVTQEAFTKAYLALKGTEKEIHLRPWLYRIVRNTALTDIRDEPRPAVELDEARASGMSPDELAEQSEEIGRLIDGLRELPEAQRAAIVMRELEGLSHEQIATSLGLSGGAVRQSIYRARRALREGLGLLVPMPLLRLLLEEGFTQGASAAAAGGGAGIAVKAGVAALLAAGTVTTGAVLNQELKSPPKADANPAKTKASASTADGADGSPADGSDSSGSSNRGPGSGGAAEHGQRGSDDGPSGHRGSNSGPGSENSGSESGHSGTGESHSGSGGGDGGEEHSGSGDSGSGGSGSSGSGSAGSGSSGSGSLSSGPGPELEPEDHSGSSGHGGSDDP